MQLSLHSDFALRVLMALAASGRRLSVDEIASGYGISRHHLAKVVQSLQSAGFIATWRGRGGGIGLAQDPRSISVGAVVRAFERFDGFVTCFPDGPGCAVNGVCGLKPALGRALEAFLAELDEVWLADLLPAPGAFAARLALPSDPVAMSPAQDLPAPVPVA